MSTDSDKPREPWLIPALWSRALDCLARRLHKWMPDCPKCARKGREASVLWLLAHEWANKCLGLENALAAEQARRGIAPGTPVADASFAVAYDTPLTGQQPRLPQPGIDQFVATEPLEEARDLADPDELEAFAFDLASRVAFGKDGLPLTEDGMRLVNAASTLTHAADRIRDVAPHSPSSASEPERLTYPQVVAMQTPKPPPIIPDAMLERARALAPPPANSWGRVNFPVAPLVLAKGEARMGRLVGVAEAQP